MVETSPLMRKMQMKTLCDRDSEPELNEFYESKHSKTIKIKWLNDLGELPSKEAPHFILANEFFDALPIQKFQVLLAFLFFVINKR